MKHRMCGIVVMPQFQQTINDAQPKASIARPGGFVYETTSLYTTDIALRLHCRKILMRFNAQD